MLIPRTAYCPISSGTLGSIGMASWLGALHSSFPGTIIPQKKIISLLFMLFAAQYGAW
jgi:hypothetical protein